MATKQNNLYNLFKQVTSAEYGRNLVTCQIVFNWLKMSKAKLQIDSEAEPPMVGDHLALDLLNTEARQGGSLLEYWNSGEDVLRWLRRHGLMSAADSGFVDYADLLEKAKALRALARHLVADRAEDTTAGIDELNEYLHAHLSAPHLGRDDKGRLTLSRIAQGVEVGSLLGPVAEAVAQLLAEDNFTLVKQCEHPDCILWFYDRTKAHKRRWCSMAACGNRYKATRFRLKNSVGVD